MPQIDTNGLKLEYDERGPRDGRPVLLIMGLGSQMTRWPDPFLDQLAGDGCRVIRFDNRDIGLSSWFDEAGIPDFGAIAGAVAAGKSPALAYSLEDMAADAVGVLDALGIERAHIVGVSMGGMIAQLVTIHYPDRVLSLTSIMSSSGNRALPRATKEAQAMLTTPAPNPETDRDAFLDRAVASSRIIGSPAYPLDEAVVRERAAADLDRAYHPAGFARQYAAIIAAPDRRARLAQIKVPTVVLHGADDPLVPVEAGRDTAANIPGAELEVVEGMWHDIPPALYGRIIAAIHRAAGRASAEAAAQ